MNNSDNKINNTDNKINNKFEDLGLSKTTFDAISKKGFVTASEIQYKAIPIIFGQKNDIIGVAQTGTGKTGAFGLPLIDLIDERNKLPQAIILAPTRELAIQVKEEIESFRGVKKLNLLTVYGGASISTQIKALRRGVDIVVGTPGRVLDLLKRGDLVLEESKYFILDEADEMLKMGFIEDIETILEASSPKKRVYLFSATMPERIKKLSKKYMKKQIILEVKREDKINKLIKQEFYKCKQAEKFEALNKIIEFTDFFYGIVFCRTKADVDNITNKLKNFGKEVDCIHGDIPQAKREKILKKFKEQKLHILVATDVAARGIDAPNLSHVINFNLPEDVETYTHRIGRTGRAGKSGNAISLVTQGEMRRISEIERRLKIKIGKIQMPSKLDILEKNKNKILVEINTIIEKKDTTIHNEICDILLENNDSKKIITALLYKINESKTNISESKKSKPSRDRNSSSGTARIFIAKGRMDKMDRRTLIRFIERETRVKIGDVDNVKICEKFSFMTLDSDEAYDIVEAFEKKNKRRPLAEIAQN